MSSKTRAEILEDRLKGIANQTLSYVGARAILNYTHLNPEQRLAYVLQMMVTQQKETLCLLEIANTIAKETVVWKDTPEGQAWKAKKETDRAAEAAKSTGV